MDNTDPDIQFDHQGICNHCQQFDIQYSQALEKLYPEASRGREDDESFLTSLEWSNWVEKIKTAGQNQAYDCILGLSGGVDSSFVAYMAKKANLRPLVVHLDNGWNSELAVANIHSICKKLNFDLHTHVIDWTEFKDLQRAFFKAQVVDIELLSDHAIFGVILNLAKKNKIQFTLSGANFATESVMPPSWVHRKSDWTNIKNIHKKFGEQKIKTFPHASTWDYAMAYFVRRFKNVKPLNMISYNKKAAMNILIDELGWRPYPGKHYESLFTKFYQAHILPVKFNIDKRKAHFSSLILSHQMTRDEALAQLNQPLYLPEDLKKDETYVLKKLGFSKEWFEQYLKSPRVEHELYGSDESVFKTLKYFRDLVGFKT